MHPFSKTHPATRAELREWSTLSRNAVGPFLAQFGIHPLGAKYPMVRIYEHLLGLSPTTADEEAILGQGFMRVGDVADRFGLSSESFLGKLRAPGNGYPPLYAFGPHRHLMLRGQVEQMLASPRNAWPALEPLPDHALPASRLARQLKVSNSRVDALLVNKADLPARIITKGHVRYIVSHVAFRLSSSASDDAASGKEEPSAEASTENTPAATALTIGGAPSGPFAEATARLAGQFRSSPSCPRSGTNARRGDGTPGASAEAKLSET